MGTPNEGINGTLATGLLAHWSFDGGSLLDESGNGLNLTKVGYPLSIQDKDGIVSNAMIFDRLNNPSGFDRNRFEVAFSYDLDNPYISMWINATKQNADGIAVAIRGSSFAIRTSNYGQIQIKYRKNNTDYTETTNSYIFNSGWKNLILNFNKSTGILNLYLNKVLICSVININAITFNTDNYILIGAGNSTNREYSCEQSIDEVRIGNRVLTDGNIIVGQTATGEIAELFEMGANYEIIRPSPSVNIDSGTYIGSITIEINAEEGSNIYYTLNGSDPDETDLLYERPITISRSVVLKAVSIKDGTLSEIVTKIYYIEEGDIGMEENQSAGLIVIGWTPEGETKETILGEVPADGQEVLSIQETINYFKTKYAGEYPTEGRVVAGAATFTVDLIESPTLRSLLSNTSAVSGTKTIIGVNSGAKAKTGKLRLHPMYAGADKSEDIVILRAAPAVTDERTYSADGKKLMKVVFTVMGVKTALETPSVSAFAAHINSSVIKVKMVNANDLGVSIASAAEGAINDATNIVNFTVGVGANRAIFFKSLDDFATAGNTSYYEPTADEVKAGSFKPADVTWTTLTALAEIPTEATGYYYKAIEIGV